MSSTAMQERRKLTRVGFQGRVEIDPVVSRTDGRMPVLEARSLNLSEGGVCVRVPSELTIHSRVVLRVFSSPRRRPVQCDGRVAWVMQRLDLRDSPPFLYDVGVELVKPSGSLRQLAVRLGLPVKPVDRATPKRLRLPAASIRGRSYVASLEQEHSSSRRWHVIVTVDDTPCFGQRCESLQDAKAAWRRFLRQRRVGG